MTVVLARRLADAGASPEVIAIAIEAVTLASASVQGLSKDASEDKRKERDKLRKREERKTLKLQREKEAAKANDVAATVTHLSSDASEDAPYGRPTFLPSLSLNLEGSIEEGSKAESKKARSENARARGQRMVAGALLTEEFREAAIVLGAAPQDVPEIWAEFVDYWVAIPGARGVKTDWLATWRNRVRNVLKRGTGNGRQQSLGDIARQLAGEVRDREREAGLI